MELAFVISLVTLLAGVCIGFFLAVVLRADTQMPIPALALVALLLLVLSHRLADRIGRQLRVRRRRGSPALRLAYAVRLEGLALGVAFGFSLVPLALGFVPSLARTSGLTDPAPLLVAIVIAAVGVLLQVELPRLAWRALA